MWGLNPAAKPPSCTGRGRCLDGCQKFWTNIHNNVPAPRGRRQKTLWSRASFYSPLVLLFPLPHNASLSSGSLSFCSSTPSQSLALTFLEAYARVKLVYWYIVRVCLLHAADVTIGPFKFLVRTQLLVHAAPSKHHCWHRCTHADGHGTLWW